IFFFQAEDGIRDFHVTGVQTCALPICFSSWTPVTASYGTLGTIFASADGTTLAASIAFPPDATLPGATTRTVTFTVGASSATARSEERRVGKECRAGGWTDHEGE